MNYAVFALTRNGIDIGQKIIAKAEDFTLFLPQKFGDIEIDARRVRFFDDFRKEVKNVLNSFKGLIFIMATGIVVRTIAPFIKDKFTDPAVVVIDEKGRFVISLLSGHLGGANELTEKIAAIISATPVITTATDINNINSIDLISKRLGFIIENPEAIKTVNSSLLNDKEVKVFIDPGCRLQLDIDIFGQGYRFVDSISNLFEAEASVIITNRVLYRLPSDRCLILRPRNIVVGTGCNRNTSAEEFERVYFSTLKEMGLSPISVKNIATMDIKKNEQGLIEFAEKCRIPIEYFSKAEIEKTPMPSGISFNALKRVGVGGVCEPAALLSAGVGELLLKKRKTGNVTIAVAQVNSI